MAIMCSLRAVRFLGYIVSALTVSSGIARLNSVAASASGDKGIVAPFYAPGSFWNTPIRAAKRVDPKSRQIMATSIVPYARLANFANGDDWGISLVYSSPNDKVYTIQDRIWYVDGPVSFAIPRGASPTTGSDHHLVVINGNKELDLWNARYNASTDTWSAGTAFIENINGWGANGAPGTKAGGAVASGFSEMGGVVRPEEIAQGHIDHALSLMVPIIRKGYIAAPATATDGTSTDPNAVPEGAHLQLDPSFNIDAQNWPTWEKIIAKALQTYGAYVSDHGGSLAVYGQTDMNAGNTSWSSVGVPKDAMLSDIPWSLMRVLKIPASSTGTVTAPESTGNTAGSR